MKRLVKSILVTGVLIIGANGLMAGPASNDWVGRIFKAKLGIAPLADTHQRAEQANSLPRGSYAKGGKTREHLV